MKARHLAVAVGIAVGFSGLVTLPVFDLLHGLSIDVLYWLRDAVVEPRYAPGESPAVVVAIDEETYRTPPFDSTPKVMWTKEIAAVMDAVYAGGATVVGWDIILPTSAQRFIRGFDRELLVSLRNAARENRVVLGRIQHSDKPLNPFPGYQIVVGRGRNVHPLNVVEDPDGVFRRVPLYFRVSTPGDPSGRKTQLQPSMSLELAARTLGVRPVVDAATGAVSIGAFEIPARVDEGMAIDDTADSMALRNDMAVRFDRGPASIPTYSIADLYACAKEGRTDYFTRHFAGKAVMFGTVLDVEDRVVTSVRYSARNAPPHEPGRCVIPAKSQLALKFDRDSIPGIFLQAAAINNFIRGDSLRELDRQAMAGLIAVLVVLVAIVGMVTGPARAAGVLAASTVVWTGTATWIFTEGLVVPLFQPFLAGILTLGTLLGYRFAVTDRMGRHIRDAFSLYLAPSMVEKLVEDGRMPVQGGEMREVTVWMSDLENYTSGSTQRL